MKEEKPILKKQSRMDVLLNKLKIDNTLTKPIFYKFPTVKQNIFPKADYNYQSDLLELPQTKLGFRYLLVMVDLWSNNFDIEPMKNKQADTCLEAMKKIFKRDILSLPKASMRTDSGGEFKGSFDKFLYDHNVFHPFSLPDRHKMMANVERLNKDLGKIFMSYLTDKSHQLGHDYNEWTDIVDEVRKELNEIRNHPEDKDPRYALPPSTNFQDPKYKIGDLVYRRLEKPVDRFGNKYHNSKFRQGDNRFETNEPRKIVDILPYGKSWRYLLKDLYNVSYDEAELMPAKESEEKYIILKIIGKKIVKGNIYYLVWWKKYKKSESTWEPKKNLLEDGAQEYIKDYEDDHQA
jgi:hypothetical protein